MEEKDLIKKQLIKHILFNFFVFTIIFTLFAIIIYGQVSSSIYRSADEQLSNKSNKFAIMEVEINNVVDGQLQPEEFQKEQIESIISSESSIQTEETENMILLNPRVFYIIRDEKGEVKSYSYSSNYYQNLAKELTFDKNALDKIYMIQTKEQYHYRAINYKVTGEDEKTEYIQVLVNVDAEIEILRNFSIILIICAVIAIFLSAIASYILSKRAMKSIIESWKKQTEFVQNVSHELRTPLTVIKTIQELLLQKPESKIIDNFEDITTLIDETKRLSNLVEDIMTLSLSDSNAIEIKKTKVSIDELIKNVTIHYEEMVELEGKKLQFQLNFKEELAIDEEKIKQLMVILLDNSLKYTEAKDTITISTEEKEGKCCIQIADTGIGIAEEDRKHIFERFYRADKARSRKTGGSGLGLSIASVIVKMHNGSITMEHNQPKGVCIQIKLPK